MVKWIALGIALGLVVLVPSCAIMTGVGVYKSLVSKQEIAKMQWANVETQYKRRADLIPNLVEVVKGYATHERTTLTAVIEARAKATQTSVNINDVSSMAKFQQSQGELSSALARLMVVVEKYPQLLAIEEFKKLHDDLAGTENRIAYEIQKYNANATDYNIATRQPMALVLRLVILGFEPMSLFQTDAKTKEAPVVKF